MFKEIVSFKQYHNTVRANVNFLLNRKIKCPGQIQEEVLELSRKAEKPEGFSCLVKSLYGSHIIKYAPKLCALQKKFANVD